jgi:hypothetical protein
MKEVGDKVRFLGWYVSLFQMLALCSEIEENVSERASPWDKQSVKHLSS